MKRLHFFGFAFFGLLSIISCKKEKNIVAPETITLNANTFQVDNKSGSIQFDVKTNLKLWSIKSNSQWCLIDTVGSDNATLTAQYNENTSFDSRTAIITITKDTIVRKIKLTQTAPVILNTSSTNLSIKSLGDTVSFSLLTNTVWTVACDQDWCSFSNKSGTNSQRIVITGSENTKENRSADIIISGGGVSKTVTILQKSHNVLFKDDFNDISNPNQWKLSLTDSVIRKLENGYYVVENTYNNNLYGSPTLNLIPDTAKDFIIETSMIGLGGGLIFGSKGGNDINTFRINADENILI